MKKHLLLFVLSFMIIKLCSAQLLCVQCFQQNDSIGVGVGANNLIVNGGFETTTCAVSCTGVYCPASSTNNCSIANWLCTGGGTLTYACVYDSAHFFVEQGTRSVYFGNSYSNACSGNSASTFPNNDTACFNYSGCTVSGIPAGFPLSGPNYGNATGLSISQTVNGLTIGNTYVLEFWAGGEYQGWFSKKGIFAVDVGFGNTFLTCKLTPQHTGIGTRYIIEFKATATSHIIKFTNWGHVCGTCTELNLDDVRLYTPAHLPPTVTTCTLGMDDVSAEENSITVYPNPANDVLTIKGIKDETSSFKIYDVLGQLVSQSIITTQQSTINISQLSKGIYMYEISGKKGKFVKE